MGLRGEQTLSPSLSWTMRSSLPLSEERRRFAGVMGGEEAGTTISDSNAAHAESSMSGWSSTGGVPGTMVSALLACAVAEDISNGRAEGICASVSRLRDVLVVEPTELVKLASAPL